MKAEKLVFIQEGYHFMFKNEISEDLEVELFVLNYLFYFGCV